MHHRGACTVLVHRTHKHLTTRIRRVHRVMYVALLGELCSRSDCQELQVHQYDIMRNISLLTTRSSDDVHCTPSAICDCYREVDWSTLCTWYFRHNQVFHTRVQCMCNQKLGVPESWLHWPTVLYPLLCHPTQPRIDEFWFVHEPQKFEIALKEVGVFEKIVLSFGVWVIGFPPRTVWKMN